jgi:hypothetical protein
MYWKQQLEKGTSGNRPNLQICCLSPGPTPGQAAGQLPLPSSGRFATPQGRFAELEVVGPRRKKVLALDGITGWRYAWMR